MNISEFRKQFPQYNELSDSDLADRIYQKYYAGKLPYEAFVGRFVAPAYPEAQKTEPPGLADKALRTLKGAGQAVKGYYDYLHTPTEPAEGVQDFMGRVIPESVAKTTVGLVEFPYHLVKSVTDPLVKAVFNADEKGVKEVVKGLGKEEAQALWQNLEGLARFAGEPIGVYGLETMKKRWLTDPAGAIVGILPLVKAGAAKVSELKGRTAPEAAEPSPTVGEKHYRVDNADEPLRDHYTFAGPQAKETAFNVAEKLATAEGKPQKVYEIPAEHIKEKGGEPVGEWAEGAEVWKTKEKMDAKELKKVGDEPINPMSEERIRAVNRLRSLKTHPKQAEYIADELGVPVEHVIDAVDAIDKNGMPTNELERILVNKAYSDQLNRYKKTVPRETPIKAREVTETPGESPTVGEGGEVTLEAGMADLEKIRNIPSYFRETLKIPDPETRTYKVTNKAVENWRVTEHEAALDAIKLQDDIWKALPDRQAREQIAYALEEPEFANSLTPQQREVYERARAFYRNYEEVLKEEGILDTFVEDYVNHIIKSTPKEARKANLGTGGNLGHKPAFTHRRVRGEGEKFFTIRELEEMGYEVEKDIANLMALYDYTAKRAIINKNLVEQIKKIKTKDGGKALRPWSKVPYEERGNYLTIDDGQLKKWSGHKFDEGIKLFQTPTALHKDAWYTVDNILKSTRPSSQLYKWFAKGRSGVKRLIMFNPLIHGFNVESNVIMALGRDYPKRFTRRTPEEVEALRREMVQNGVELEGLFDVRRKLEQDIYIPKLTERGKWDLKRSNFRNIMNHPIQAIRHWGDAILWDKWVKSGQMVVYDVLKKRFLKKMSEADAGHAAAMVTNDLLGTMPSTWFTKNQRRFLFNTMFARNWTVSNLRTLTGMLGKRAKSGWLPKPLRFENVTDAQLKEMSKEYRKIILKGVVGSIATANAVQAMFLKANGMPIHPIWKNEEEHRMDIDTGMIDTKGRKIYLKNWLFRQIDDYAKLFEGHPIQFAKAKAEPIMRTIAEIVLNVDYFGKPIVKRGMEWKRSLKEIGKYVVKGITPLDNFVGRENEVRTWAEALIPLTGTWIRHGIATGSADNRFANILRGYYEYRAKKSIMTDDLKARVKKLIQQGKDSEAWRLVDGVNLTPEQYINIQKSLKMPFWYRVGGRKKLKSDFVEYLMTLPDDERAEFWDAVQDATIDRSLNKKKRR